MMKPLQTTQLTYEQACSISDKFYCVCVYHHESEFVFPFNSKLWTIGVDIHGDGTGEYNSRQEIEDEIGYLEMDKEFSFVWFHTL